MQRGVCEFFSESDFENAFEEDISEEDKAYIFAVTTRLSRILNWTPSDDKQIFEKRQNGPQVIRELLSQFYRWKEFMSRSDAEHTQRIRHLVTFSLAKLCLHYWITDSELVADIIREVFECDGHFSSLFAHVVNGHDRRSLFRQTSNFFSQKEDSVTIFFLHHALKQRVMFHGVRFIDIRVRFPLTISPVFLAAIYSKPNLLLNLLRFGAIIELTPNRILDDWTLPMVLRHLTRILWNSLGEDLQLELVNTSVQSTIMSNTIHQVSECFRIILRAIPQIRMGEIDFLLMKFEGGVLSGSVWSHDFIRRLSKKDIVPMLVNRYFEPSDLYHLCRCVIRGVLNKSWNLPYGIDLLPLPKVLKNYLALSRD